MERATPNSEVKHRSAIGFIYVVTTVKKDYYQSADSNVPTPLGDRLYFGPCKAFMRSRMQVGDYVFGISPYKTKPRKLIFGTELEERISFAEAYHRFPKLRGPEGPIHVEPIQATGDKPFAGYKHIEGAIHAKSWCRDVAGECGDAFFIGRPLHGWLGAWLGKSGPVLDDQILQFLQTCSVFGQNALPLKDRNIDATATRPVAHGGRSVGLHLETSEPKRLLELCGSRLSTLSNN